MRLSPVLAAFLALSATFSLSTSARGETADVIVDSVPDLAQAQPSEPANPIPPAGTQSVPQQETPDRIEISPSAPPPAQPTAPASETPPQPTAPASETTPQPTPSPEATPTPSFEATPSETPQILPGDPNTAPPTTAEPEPRVLVAEVLVSGVEGDLQNEVYRVIRTQPGRTTTRSELQTDINEIFATGYFANVRAVPEDTPLGVRVTFEVQANPILRSVQIEGATVLPESVVQEAFADQYGQTLNLVRLQEGIKRINSWYQERGYVLAQILDPPRIAEDGTITLPKITEDGTVTLQVAEGVVEDVQVRFINKEGEDKDAKGTPIRGRTRSFIVTREFELKPGAIFNRQTVERDLQRVYGLGIFDDVRLSLNPGQDPRKVVVVANVVEKNTGSIAAGAGISSASGLFGTLSYQQQNFGGNNQKLGAEVQVGQRELLFDLNFTDPWIGGDPFRTSYTLNLFRRRTISLIFDGGEPEVKLPNGDRPRVVRTGGGISFTRPLTNDIYRRPEWVASLGAQYQRVAIRDSDGDLSLRDRLGNPLSFSGEGKDDLFTLQLGVVRDLRNDPLRPTQGSLFRLGTEQSVPIGLGNLFFNRIRGSYSYYIPTRLVRFTQGCRDSRSRSSDCPQAFAFNIQAGTVLGDLPPYEAFSLGGSNSVRGYDEGDLAAARTFIQATAEYRFPVFSIISGALFVDAATDFGSQESVLGNPGGVRNKPGSGIGYGVGVRIQSPLGPIRIDYGLNDQGDSRLHFGIGERF